VRLRSADPAAAPAIDLGYFREPADLGRLAAGLARIRESASAAVIAELSCGTELAPGPDVANGDRGRLRGWIRRAAWTYHHPVGTCAMGPAPGSGSVVDAAGALGAELPVPPDATPQTRFLAMLGRSELFSLP
jgi:choline dehydrogenase